MRSKCVVLVVTRVIRPAISTRRYCFNEERCWLKPRKLEDRSTAVIHRFSNVNEFFNCAESNDLTRRKSTVTIVKRDAPIEQAETRRAMLLLRTERLYSFDSVTNIDRQTDAVSSRNLA